MVTDDAGIWLLDLEVGGRVHRYATEAVDVTTASGSTVRYLEGLSAPGLTFGSVAGVDDASVAVEVLGEVDWAEAVADGHTLDRCPCTLRRWFPGRTLERARIVLRGVSSAPVYGAQGEPLSVSIVRSMRDQTRTIPPSQGVVDDSTWPVTGGGYVSPDRAQGAAYPLVIGAPGGTEDATPIPCVPVPQVEHPATVGDGVLAWVGGHASQVRVRYDGDTPASSTETVTATADLLGRVVQTSPTAGSNFDDQGAYYVGFRDDTTFGGGLLYRGELLRGAGSVIEWVLLEHFDGQVDRARMSAARPFLDAFKVDTYINAPVVAWDWLAREILPYLPVELREGPDGVYPAVLRYDLTVRDAVVHLDATDGTGNVSRSSSVALVGEPVNELTIDYRPGGESGSRWLARRVLTARSGRPSGVDGSPTTDTRVLVHPLCAASQARYGLRPRRLQLSSVWDTTTALQIGRHILDRDALPRRAVQYTGGVWLEEAIEIGQAVTVTDPDLHLTGAVAMVADLTPGSAETVLDLLILTR